MNKIILKLPYYIDSYLLCFAGEKDHFHINLEDEVVRGSIVTLNVSLTSTSIISHSCGSVFEVHVSLSFLARLEEVQEELLYCPRRWRRRR